MNYLHFGVPYGNLSYSVSVSGNGKICFYSIKNSDSIDLNCNNLDKLGEIEINSESFQKYSQNLYIPNNPESEFNQLCETIGNKIMGIKITFSSGLEIKDISLTMN